MVSAIKLVWGLFTVKSACTGLNSVVFIRGAFMHLFAGTELASNKPMRLEG